MRLDLAGRLARLEANQAEAAAIAEEIFALVDGLDGEALRLAAAALEAWEAEGW